jgi:hypothetical protein
MQRNRDESPELTSLFSGAASPPELRLSSLALCREKNRVELRIFNQAERLFGPGQNVLLLLSFQPLTGSRDGSRLTAWRDYVKRAGMPLDE